MRRPTGVGGKFKRRPIVSELERDAAWNDDWRDQVSAFAH
jgi:hypothetical protein